MTGNGQSGGGGGREGWPLFRVLRFGGFSAASVAYSARCVQGRAVCLVVVWFPATRDPPSPPFCARATPFNPFTRTCDLPGDFVGSPLTKGGGFSRGKPGKGDERGTRGAQRGAVRREERARETVIEGERERERAFADRDGPRRVTPVEELLMSRPKTPFFGHSFSSFCHSLTPPFPPSMVFCRLTSRWSEQGVVAPV